MKGNGPTENDIQLITYIYSKLGVFSSISRKGFFGKRAPYEMSFVPLNPCVFPGICYVEGVTQNYTVHSFFW